MRHLILSEETRKKLKIRKLENITTIVLHHSAGRGTLEDVDRIHRKRGYICIGYHYYMTRDGEIHLGRPLFTVGAHAKGRNKDTIGICLEGDFRKDGPTDKPIEALTLNVKNLMKTMSKSFTRLIQILLLKNNILMQKFQFHTNVKYINLNGKYLLRIYFLDMAAQNVKLTRYGIVY